VERKYFIFGDLILDMLVYEKKYILFASLHPYLKDLKDRELERERRKKCIYIDGAILNYCTVPILTVEPSHQIACNRHKVVTQEVGRFQVNVDVEMGFGLIWEAYIYDTNSKWLLKNALLVIEVMLKKMYNVNTVYINAYDPQFQYEYESILKDAGYEYAWGRGHNKVYKKSLSSLHVI